MTSGDNLNGASEVLGKPYKIEYSDTTVPNLATEIVQDLASSHFGTKQLQEDEILSQPLFLRWSHRGSCKEGVENARG